MYTNQQIPLNLMFYIIITYVAKYMENLHVSKLLNSQYFGEYFFLIFECKLWKHYN